jgi:hypothetical protein
MTLAWRMYVWMYVCMGWQAGWERICLVGGELLEGGWARVRKKHQGPQSQEFQSIGRGEQNKRQIRPGGAPTRA